MRRVTNCILRNKENRVLMLQKPSKNWWVVPGGKMEQSESITESVTREYYEETNLKINNPALKGVFTIIIQEKESNEMIDEWMMFTFYADDYSGNLTEHCDEGHLEWKDIQDIPYLPKAEGDNVYLDHILKNQTFLTGKFIYTTDYELISYELDQLLQLEPVRS